MRQFETYITQRFAVPTLPDYVVSISEKREGKFSVLPAFSEQGTYIVSVEKSEQGNWRYVAGTTSGELTGYTTALRRAEFLWSELSAQHHHHHLGGKAA